MFDTVMIIFHYNWHGASTGPVGLVPHQHQYSPCGLYPISAVCPIASNPGPCGPSVPHQRRLPSAPAGLGSLCPISAVCPINTRLGPAALVHHQRRLPHQRNGWALVARICHPNRSIPTRSKHECEWLSSPRRRHGVSDVDLP